MNQAQMRIVREYILHLQKLSGLGVNKKRDKILFFMDGVYIFELEYETILSHMISGSYPPKILRYTFMDEI